MCYFYFLSLCMLIFKAHAAPTPHIPALICTPVADLVGQPMKHFYGPSHSSRLLYTRLPECGAGELSKALLACPRLHQALLHDQVEIVRQQGNEVCIKIPYTLFVTNNTVHQKTFWTRQSNVIPLKQIKNADRILHERHVTLIRPSYIKELDITLSVGTKLPIAAPEDATCDENVAVYILNVHTKKFERYAISKANCVMRNGDGIQDRINLFLTILRSWASQSDGTIPYVWGGTSFTATNPEQTFETRKVYAPYGTHQYAYTYPSNTNSIKTGFDCSGLINRAAQIAGIPYYCKNSITASQLLAPLKGTDTLSAGDLLWFPGHIIVVSNVDTNTLIEARGYDHGYGKVHEIPLSEQFEGIQTYAQLIQAYQTQTPLRRLDRHGNVVQVIPTYKILKLASVFSSPYAYARLNMLPIK